MSRKDIFYSGSVYNLALDMSEEKRISDNSLKGYRQSIVSIPRNGTFAHRGSVVACHLSIPSEEILDPELLKEKIETTNPIMNVLKEMLDFDIMLNPLFALICISNIFGEFFKSDLLDHQTISSLQVSWPCMFRMSIYRT